MESALPSRQTSFHDDDGANANKSKEEEKLEIKEDTLGWKILKFLAKAPILLFCLFGGALIGPTANILPVEKDLVFVN